MLKQHFAQHGPGCYGCKVQTLQFVDDQPKTHQHKGDPWDGNPVKERIEELQKEGQRVQAFELSAQGAKEL